MTNLGYLISSKFPRLYDFITINVLKSRNRIHYYVMDAYGSFKEFFFENEMLPIYKNLVEDLDEQSKKTVEVIIERLKSYPDKKNISSINAPSLNNEIIGGVLEEESVIFDPFLCGKRLGLHLNSRYIHSSTFYFNHGLTLLPSKVSEYICGKSIIDLGAYIGDSTIALNQLNPSKIYSVEMSPSTIEKYEKNMMLNGISKDKYEIINCAISNENSFILVNKLGEIGSSLNNITTINSEDSIKIQVLTLDSVIAKYNIADIGFIKADLEGFAYECVEGGLKTLIDHRPVLSFAIYHNPKEFFTLKPFLKSKLDNYTYIIRRLATEKEYAACHAETVLLAYPNEILS